MKFKIKTHSKRENKVGITHVLDEGGKEVVEVISVNVLLCGYPTTTPTLHYKIDEIHAHFGRICLIILEKIHDNRSQRAASILNGILRQSLIIKYETKASNQKCQCFRFLGTRFSNPTSWAFVAMAEPLYRQGMVFEELMPSLEFSVNSKR